MTTEKKCINCKFFEERTGFCRKEPPKPVVIKENGQCFISSVFAKIPMPQLDFCHEFQINIC